ncbi:LysR family transcriptional regulator [Rouxiella sp. S1S-2]|uniref:LysR family transcriptional regulator n=1 Tax=Rouxiella sp. S1S-2 TaxID=2653856 RepID=UPI0012652E2F|nr:LysR family transcriptional regulator [Rouxiella sp. S1S-2]KAB7895572.1 LysR family transcriptional regulator [Rouxiella sp. S1S-2]
MDFKGLDLNLLVAFDALMEERNVTRAALKAAVSQPAMSAALSRLRTHFADPLFIRSASGLLPTARAKEIGLHVSKALNELANLLLPDEIFSPEGIKTSFTIGMSEYPLMVLLPGMMKAINQQAPGVTVHIRTFVDRDESVSLLDAGKIDMAVGIAPSQAENRILSLPLFSDEFVTLVRKDSEAAKNGMTLETYLSMGHILVSPEGHHYGLVDEQLRSQGLSRELRLTVPTMFAVAEVVQQTNYVATVLKRSVLISEKSDKVVMFKPPVDMPEILFHLLWHRRSTDGGAQKWLRTLICAQSGELN